jgi:hypothetical protein
MGKAMGPLIGALFTSVSPRGGKTPKGQDKKRAQSSKGEKSVTEPAQQHGELSAFKEPTPIQRTKMHARDAKVSATRDWVDGRITTKQHNSVHTRANHVLSSKPIREFKGTSGEKAPSKGKMAW